MSDPAAAQHVAAQRRRIDEVLGRSLTPGEPVALIDFPSYPNVGDSAIWLGALTWLKRNRSPIRYVASHRDYATRTARRRIGDATVLLSGGGNLGDLYPWHQRLRLRVISDFPANRIVQLTQSIAFSEDAALAEAARVMAAHPDLLVLARDRRSLATAREGLGCEAVLCPDIAFGLGSLARMGGPEHDLIAVVRADEHSAVDPGSLAGVPAIDWIAGHGPRQGALLLRALKPLEVSSGRAPALGRLLAPMLARFYRRYAALRLRAGLTVLCGGRVVITDRLHGHILATLLGVPSVLLDDRTGKLRAYAETWLGGLESAELAAGPAAAAAAAVRLLDRARDDAGAEPLRGTGTMEGMSGPGDRTLARGEGGPGYESPPAVRPARLEDREEILAVMRPANMDRVDSPEMPKLEIDRFFVAEVDGRIVGAAGWQLLGDRLAKTTLLAVLPEAAGRGIGSMLQRARMDAMRAAGATRVRTNADRPETIEWYKRHFGYRVVGTLEKEDEFGDPEIGRWTTLEADLVGAEQPMTRRDRR